jgi:phosphoglucomutase
MLFAGSSTPARPAHRPVCASSDTTTTSQQSNGISLCRLSGTGSSGATIRMYIEQYSKDPSSYGKQASEALKPIINAALKLSKLKEFTGRQEPTVIT